MKGCLSSLSSSPPRLPILVVVVVSLTHLSAATERGRNASSWYDSAFNLKLPEDFPVNTTILRLAPVTPSPRRGTNSIPTEAQVSGIGVEYVLLENKLNLFQIHQDPLTGVISLSLRRLFTYSDYLSYVQNSVEAVVGPVGTRYRTYCGNGKRGNGNGGNGRRRNGGGSDARECWRGAGSRRDSETDPPDDGVIYIKIHIVDKFICAKPSAAACYLPEETLKLIQWENRGSSPLLGLPFPNTTCPDLVAAYDITMTGDKSWPAELSTSKRQLMVTPTRLDRERRGETIGFTVTCALKSKGEPVLAPQTKQGILTILDEDDSPPIRSRHPSVDWHFSNKTDDDSHYH